MRTMVMAAGRGSRLAPLTDVVPKPVLPVANEPVMGRLLRQLARAGLRDVVCNTSHLAPVMESVFGDGDAHGVRLSWSRETQMLGTAGGVRNAQDLLVDGDEPVLVLSADGLHDVDLNAVVSAHRSSEALVTIVFAEVADPSEFGVAILDSESRITGFQEKPAAGTELSRLASTGIYVLSPAVFERMPAAGTFHDFGSELFPELLRDLPGTMFGYVHRGYWNDIGGFDDFRRGGLDIVSGTFDGDGPTVELTGDSLIHHSASIHPEATVIGPCVIGPDAVLEKGATVIRSVVLPGACVASGTVVSTGVVSSLAGLGTWVDDMCGAPIAQQR